VVESSGECRGLKGWRGFKSSPMLLTGVRVSASASAAVISDVAGDCNRLRKVTSLQHSSIQLRTHEGSSTFNDS